MGAKNAKRKRIAAVRLLEAVDCLDPSPAGSKDAAGGTERGTAGLLLGGAHPPPLQQPLKQPGSRHCQGCSASSSTTTTSSASTSTGWAINGQQRCAHPAEPAAARALWHRGRRCVGVCAHAACIPGVGISAGCGCQGAQG